MATAGAAEATEQHISQRPVYGTVKHRASDLTVGDVTRNRFGKWDVVESVNVETRFVSVRFEVGGEHSLRTVHLVDVQVVKPS